ncbi:hypothetical protein OG21DRAFT_1494973 [Imleria badia]|nr:hypothetical protein OG21DRAFT_1494973 [Imleria badia]
MHVSSFVPAFLLATIGLVAAAAVPSTTNTVPSSAPSTGSGDCDPTLLQATETCVDPCATQQAAVNQAYANRAAAGSTYNAYPTQANRNNVFIARLIKKL